MVSGSAPSAAASRDASRLALSMGPSPSWAEACTKYCNEFKVASCRAGSRHPTPSRSSQAQGHCSGDSSAATLKQQGLEAEALSIPNFISRCRCSLIVQSAPHLLGDCRPLLYMKKVHRPVGQLLHLACISQQLCHLLRQHNLACKSMSKQVTSNNCNAGKKAFTGLIGLPHGSSQCLQMLLPSRHQGGH
jgi:hypothetical protein